MESLTVAQMIVFPVCSASASRCSLSRLAVSVNILHRTDIRDGDGQCWRLLHRSLDALCLRRRLLHSQAQLILTHNLIAISHPHMQIKSQNTDSEKQEVFLLHPADQAEPIDLP